MTPDPTAIHPDSTAADVLAAFLPIVEATFAEPARFITKPWGKDQDGNWHRMSSLTFAPQVDLGDPWGGVWAVVAASYLMGPLMRLEIATRRARCAEPGQSLAASGAIGCSVRELDAAAIRLRDYWCSKRQETDR